MSLESKTPILGRFVTSQERFPSFAMAELAASRLGLQAGDRRDGYPVAVAADFPGDWLAIKPSAVGGVISGDWNLAGECWLSILGGPVPKKPKANQS